MKIAILSRNESCYSTKRLLEAATARGHEAACVDFLNCYMNITSKKPSIHNQALEMVKYDAIIPRISAKRTFYGASIVRQFEAAKVYTPNPSIAISRSRDKLRSLQLLAMKGIGLPVTVFAHSPNDINDFLKMVGGPPVVIKLIEGTQGVGVVLAETKKAAESVIQAFMGMNANIIVQEFIKESEGTDLRCFVLGDKVIAAIQRKAQPGEFRSNIHRGGVAEMVKPTAAEKKTAIHAAKAMGLQLAGVDIIRSDRGPLVLEVNSSPGLEGIETATQKDIAGMIIQHIEENATIINRRRYQG